MVSSLIPTSKLRITGESYKFACAPPNSCKTVQACSQGHNSGYLDNQVLFQCGRRYVCCPPTQEIAATYGNQGSKTEEATLQRIRTTTELWQEASETTTITATSAWSRPRSTTLKTTQIKNRPQRTTESWQKLTTSYWEGGTTEKQKGYGTTEAWQEFSKNSQSWSGSQRTTASVDVPSTTPTWQRLPAVTESWHGSRKTTSLGPSRTTGSDWEDDFYSDKTTARPAAFPRPVSASVNAFSSHRNWKLLPESCGLTLNNKITGKYQLQSIKGHFHQ